jgi:hypothetical protein
MSHENIFWIKKNIFVVLEKRNLIQVFTESIAIKSSMNVRCLPRQAQRQNLNG